MTGCGRCGKSVVGRRTRCACKTLVHKCCWCPFARQCVGCRDHDRPKDTEDLAAHLKRIKARRDALDQALKTYETACCAFWDGDYTREKLTSWDIPTNAPSVREAFDDLVLVIRQACEDLGTPEELVEFPTIAFPGFCDDGSTDYGRGNLEAIEMGICGVGAVS